MRRTIVGIAAAVVALIAGDLLGTSQANAQYVGSGSYRVRVNPRTGVAHVRGRAYAPAVVDTYVAPTTYVTSAPLVTTTRVVETAPVVTTTRVLTPTLTAVPLYPSRMIVPAPVVVPRVYTAPLLPTVYAFPY